MSSKLDRQLARLEARRRAWAASDPHGTRRPGSMNAHKHLSIRTSRRRGR